MTIRIDTEALFLQWELFLLILVRITSFVYTAPFFSTSSVPQRAKLGLSVFLAYLIFLAFPDQSYVYESVIDFALLIVKESVVGLIIGFCAGLCMQCVHFAGHIIDVNMGLSMATMYDPATRMQVNLSGQLYYYAVLLLMLFSGLHSFLIQAIVDTYTVLPVGSAVINPGLYSSVIAFIVDYFIIGFRIALPVFITIMLLNCILGIMAKIAPQMNMFAVGMQLKITVGLAVMYFTVSMLPAVANQLAKMMKDVIVRIVEGLYA